MDAHKLEIRDLKIHPDKIPVAGQSWGEFKRNCCEAIQRYVRMGMESSAPIVLVTHGSFIQVLFSEYGDWEDEGHYDHTPLDQTGIAAIYLTRNGFELKILRGAKESPDE